MHPIYGMIAGTFVAVVTLGYFAELGIGANAVFLAIGFGLVLAGSIFGNMVDNTELPDEADGETMAALGSMM